MAPAQGTSNVPLQCQRVKMSLRAELCGPGEGLRRKEGPSEESQSVRKGFSEVGHNRAFEDGLLENGGALHPGGCEERHRGGPETAAATAGAYSVPRFTQPRSSEPTLRPCGLDSAGDVSMTQAWLLHAGTAI